MVLDEKKWETKMGPLKRKIIETLCDGMILLGYREKFELLIKHKNYEKKKYVVKLQKSFNAIYEFNMNQNDPYRDIICWIYER